MSTLLAADEYVVRKIALNPRLATRRNMILMFSYPFVVVFSSSENNNKSAQKRNGNWTAREMPLALFLSFFLSLPVAGKEEELKQLYIYLARSRDSL